MCIRDRANGHGAIYEEVGHAIAGATIRIRCSGVKPFSGGLCCDEADTAVGFFLGLVNSPLGKHWLEFMVGNGRF